MGQDYYGYQGVPKLPLEVGPDTQLNSLFAHTNSLVRSACILIQSKARNCMQEVLNKGRHILNSKIPAQSVTLYFL